MTWRLLYITTHSSNIVPDQRRLRIAKLDKLGLSQSEIAPLQPPQISLVLLLSLSLSRSLSPSLDLDFVFDRQRDRDRERAQARSGKKGSTKDDGLTPEQRRKSVPVISKYPNLPFNEQDDPPGEDQEGASVSGSRERPTSKAPALDEDSSSSSPDHQQLARSFSLKATFRNFDVTSAYILVQMVQRCH
ncbi:hypothetical protein NL676_004440 [Syzygium grande]|nr:hypothetical protein NL676_004440 [Syzygium grande]